MTDPEETDGRGKGAVGPGGDARGGERGDASGKDRAVRGERRCVACGRAFRVADARAAGKKYCSAACRKRAAARRARRATRTKRSGALAAARLAGATGQSDAVTELSALLASAQRREVRDAARIRRLRDDVAQAAAERARFLEDLAAAIADGTVTVAADARHPYVLAALRGVGSDTDREVTLARVERIRDERRAAVADAVERARRDALASGLGEDGARSAMLRAQRDAARAQGAAMRRLLGADPWLRAALGADRDIRAYEAEWGSDPPDIWYLSHDWTGDSRAGRGDGEETTVRPGRDAER